MTMHDNPEGQEEKMRAEFHAWNEDMSGNENQEISKYRMQGWMGCASQYSATIARLEEEKREAARLLATATIERSDLKEKLAAAELSNRQFREALKPFAAFSCDEPCRCHNCTARDLLAQPISTEALDAYVAKLIPPGWKVVPIEPIIDMRILGCEAGYNHDDGDDQDRVTAMYVAMVTSAPLPPSPDKKD